VKEFWKLVINWRRYGQKESSTFFMAHPVHQVPACLASVHLCQVAEKNCV